MTDRSRIDPRATIQPTGDAVTLPAHHAVSDATAAAARAAKDASDTRPKVITNIEIFDLLVTMRSENASELGDVKRDIKGIRNDQTEDRARIAALEAVRASSMRPRALSLSGLREDDVEHSLRGSTQEEQNTAIAKGIVRNRKQTNTQTGLIVGALIALATAGTSYLNNQNEKMQRESAHEAAEAAAKAAAEAAKASMRAPTPTPPGAY